MRAIKAWALVWRDGGTAPGRSGDAFFVFRTKRAAVMDMEESDEPGTVKVVRVEIRELPRKVSR